MGDSYTFVIEGGVDTEVTLTEMADGSIQVTVKVLDTSGQIGDLRGVFFDIGDESLLSGMTIDGTDIGATQIEANSVKKVSGDVNLNGETIKEFDAFDAGAETGTSGIGSDDIRETTFNIASTSGDLSIEDFLGMDWGFRYTSVGVEGGDRSDSLKIGGTAPNPGSISGTMFVDANMDGQSNDNGGMPSDGFAGIEVQLLDSMGNVIATTTTDADGNYQFRFVDAGTYSVAFAEPTDYNFTPNQNVGDDATDSDVDPMTGATGAIIVSAGMATENVDAGVFEDPAANDPMTASIGDTVFVDFYSNGIQDSFEVGAAGVTVELLDSTGTVIATTVTGPDGSYLFENLAAGNYSLKFTAPEGYTLTAANAGADDTVDSDADQTTGLTGTISLAAGEARTDVDAGIHACGFIQGDSGSNPNAPNGGDDLLVGCETDDLILGKSGDDLLYGMGGNDQLYSGPGNDVLFGGAGRDQFVFDGRALEEGDVNTVMDFDFAEQDALVFLRFGEGKFDDLVGITQVVAHDGATAFLIKQTDLLAARDLGIIGLESIDADNDGAIDDTRLTITSDANMITGTLTSTEVTVDLIDVDLQSL